MAISSLGIGSGLDLNGILTSLMEVEQQPLIALQKKEFSSQSRISSLGTLRSALASLQSAAASLAPDIGKTAVRKPRTLRATATDGSIATATVFLGPHWQTSIRDQQSRSHRRTNRGIGQCPDESRRRSNGTLSIEVGGTDAIDYHHRWLDGYPRSRPRFQRPQGWVRPPS
jgi:flagellar hook-associated protein 2